MLESQGMSFDEFKEITEYIKEHNSWEYMCTNFDGTLDNVIFKYYDVHIDTRTNDIWAVTFRQISHGHDAYGDEVFIRETGGKEKFIEDLYKFLKTPVSEARKLKEEKAL